MIAFIRNGILFLIVLNSWVFNGQSDISDSKQYYKWFDSIFENGNSELYNGYKYSETFRTEKGNHQFFLTRNFQLGNLVYSGQTFFDVSLKYDLFHDEIIVKLPNQSAFVIIKLVKNNVHSFSIDGLDFINISSEKNKIDSDQNGFYQILKEMPLISVYKKYVKTKEDYISDLKSYSKFKEKRNYLIRYNDSHFTIDSYKDVRRLFPNYKNQISSFYKREKKQYKSNKDEFYRNLMTEINLLLVKREPSK